MEQPSIRGVNAEKHTDLKGLQEIMSFLISEINNFGVVFKSSRHLETIKTSLEGADVIGNIKITNKPYIKSESHRGLMNDDFGSLIGGIKSLKRSLSQPEISLSGHISVRPAVPNACKEDASVTKCFDTRPLKSAETFNRGPAKDSNNRVSDSKQTTMCANSKKGQKSSAGKKEKEETMKVKPNIGYVSPMQHSTCASEIGNETNNITNQRQQIATPLRGFALPQRNVSIPQAHSNPSSSTALSHAIVELRQIHRGIMANTGNEQESTSNTPASNLADETEEDSRPRIFVPLQRHFDDIDNFNELDSESLLQTRHQTPSSILQRGNSSNVGQYDAENAGYVDDDGTADMNIEPVCATEESCEAHHTYLETADTSNTADSSITRVKQVHKEDEKENGNNTEESDDQTLPVAEVMVLKSVNLQSDTSITQVKTPMTESQSEPPQAGLANYKRFTSSQIPIGDNWSFLSESNQNNLEGTSERDNLISSSSSSEDSDLSSIA